MMQNKSEGRDIIKRYIKDSPDKPVLIAGPCSIESLSMFDETASFLDSLRGKYNIVLKASYDKANRTSVSSFRGPGLEKGLDIIAQVKDKYGLPLLVDVHCRNNIDEVSKIADIIQIPAFLCRQTDLLLKASETGLFINIKKGQFMSPWAMNLQVEKVSQEKRKNIFLTERGTSFGYGDLIVDMRAVLIMKKAGNIVLFDATHSQQQPPAGSSTTGGAREFILPLSLCARTAGANGIYCEVHPDPVSAKSDAATQLDFAEFKELAEKVSSL